MEAGAEFCAVKIEAMRATDWSEVAAIYAGGIAEGHVTFAGRPLGSRADFMEGKLME